MKTKLAIAGGVALALLALVSGRASAQSDDALQRARTHFEAGRALYSLGNYTEAEREFAAGYELAPRRKFLINLGQCYRKLDDLDKARVMFERYLHEAADDDPERVEVQQMLREIEAQIAARPAPTPPPPPATAQPAPPSLLALDAPPPHVTATPQRKSWIKRNWWIIPVGAVVVGAAVGTGVYFGLRATPACGSKDLVCVDGTQWH